MQKAEEAVGQSGKFRVVSVDSQAGSILNKTRVVDIAHSERRVEFNSLEEATAVAYWDVYRERRYSARVDAGESPPLIDEDESPPQWFIDNLQEEKKNIKGGDHCTSEFMYIYGPDGTRLDTVHV
ncbi:MAG TPA: hypothetical protein VGA53_00120 [Candidatus Paceibacterota bacterium]